MSDQNYLIVMRMIWQLLVLPVEPGRRLHFFRVSKHLDGCSVTFKQTEGLPLMSSLMCSSGAGATRWNWIRHQCKIVWKYWSVQERSTIEMQTGAWQRKSPFFKWHQCYFSKNSKPDSLITLVLQDCVHLQLHQYVAWTTQKWQKYPLSSGTTQHSKINDSPNWMKQPEI